MRPSLQITFRNTLQSETVERAIRERAESLGRYCGRIEGCRVLLEERHRRHQQGNLYHLRVCVAVPGDEIVVTREPRLHHAHEDVYVTIRDAFNAVRRRLEDRERRHRHQVKTHDSPPRGRVAFLDPFGEYGFIETHDGRDVYFHRNSVVNGYFDRLEPGAAVRFREEPGENGPQASSVLPCRGRAGEA